MDLATPYKYALAAYGDRFADPLQLRRDLLRASGGRLWEWAAEARDLQDNLAAAPDHPDGPAARVRLAELEGLLAQAGYKAFGLPPIDPNTGKGVAEAEVVAALKGYLEYAEGKG